MDKKNLQELAKLGLSKKTISLMTESEAKLLFEKINKKKEAKEAVATVTQNTKIDPQKDKVPPGTPFATAQKMAEKGASSGLVKTLNTTDINTEKQSLDKLVDPKELGEGKKKKTKYNPWAVCTASVGRKDKKKYEDCVMGVKKKLKEGKNPYEYLIESKMEEIVETHLAPKISKKELIQIIQEKKMKMKKPIGKSTMIDGEVGEGETKEKEKVKTKPETRPTSPNKKPSEAPHPAKAMMKGETMENETKEKTKEKERTTTTPKTRPGSPNKNPRPDQSPAPAKAEKKKEEFINAIVKLIGN